MIYVIGEKILYDRLISKAAFLKLYPGKCVYQTFECARKKLNQMKYQEYFDIYGVKGDWKLDVISITDDYGTHIFSAIDKKLPIVQLKDITDE